jgi:hypothetical protein
MFPYPLHLFDSWIQGLTWIAVLLLTLWPTRRRLTVASVLWLLASLLKSGSAGYSLFVGVAMVMSYSSRSFPVLAWLLPLVSLGVVFAEASLLRSSVRPDAAMRVGRILLLVVDPALQLVPHVGSFLRGIPDFPLGVVWLVPVLLWFRIREQQSGLYGGHPEGFEQSTSGDVIPQ